MTGGYDAARLSGTGRLADDLYLLAHHDVTGRPYAQPRAIGLGLAGALLAELTLAGKIEITCDQILLADRPRPADGLAGHVLALLVGEREPRLSREWLAYLARSAARDVANRLEASGYLTQAPARLPWRGNRWVPVDPDCAFASLARACPALQAAAATTYNAILAGLAVACGLGPRLFPYGPPGSRRNLALALGRLQPGARELVAQVQAAVDSAVLAQRV